MADAELDEKARVRVEALRDALIGEANKLAQARDVAERQKEILSARTTILDLRVTEILDHIERVDPAYARLRLLACVEDMVASAFQIGAKGESNAVVEMALTKHREQTKRGRDMATAATRGARARRHDLMRPLVLKVVKEFPDEGPRKIARHLRRKRKVAEQFAVSWPTFKADVAAIMAENSVQSFHKS